MTQFIEIFQYKFLINAFIGALLAAAATSLLSVFITLKKISFLGEAFSHIAFAGIALSFLIGTEMTLTTLLFVLIVAVLIAIISKYYQYQEANIITIFLSVSMAIGIILVNLNKDYILDLGSYLFGNVLLVSKGDLIFLSILIVANLAFVILFFKELFYLTYNFNIAKLYGVPVNLVYYLFILLLAVNIVVSVKIVGVIMITAQLILPGISALNLTRSVRKAIFYSFIIAEVGAIGGFYISYRYNLPSGSSIVLLTFLIFILTLLYKEIILKRKL
ncbi:MAG: metal ABC transporter permease [Candidatus Cloacimonas sp.]|jgi:zinc transport system permease protein|nr:metal ABC transporter permease [Candidatus Cloacimonadota bacterium]